MEEVKRSVAAKGFRGGNKRLIGRAQGIFKVVKLFCMIL